MPAARAAEVRLVSGASSIPALSHAVLDLLVAGWREVEAIRIGIFPGNRAPRGLSVVEAILSYSGKPVRVFRTGGWGEQWGWGGLHRVDAGPAGKRWASACDTPEQELLVARYRPTQSAEFFAGMELSVLHLGFACSACRCDGDGSARSALRRGQCSPWLIGCCRSAATRVRCWSKHAGWTVMAGSPRPGGVSMPRPIAALCADPRDRCAGSPLASAAAIDRRRALTSARDAEAKRIRRRLSGASDRDELRRGLQPCRRRWRRNASSAR